MPLYEYECGACGHRFESIQKFSDAPVERCPKCGGAVHKLQSAPAFHLKGTGWYVTDYAKKDQTGAEKSDSGSEAGAKEASTTGEKAETPAGKTDKSDKTDKPDKTEKKADTKSLKSEGSTPKKTEAS
jgi:putative FmdB family regulatory protein